MSLIPACIRWKLSESVTRPTNIVQTLKFIFMEMWSEPGCGGSPGELKTNTQQSKANPHPVICDFTIISATVNVPYADLHPPPTPASNLGPLL